MSHDAEASLAQPCDGMIPPPIAHARLTPRPPPYRPAPQKATATRPPSNAIRRYGHDDYWYEGYQFLATGFQQWPSPRFRVSHYFDFTGAAHYSMRWTRRAKPMRRAACDVRRRLLPSIEGATAPQSAAMMLPARIALGNIARHA